jgi:hypothetical protein
MPAAERTERHLPKYGHYKPKDLAVVRIDGHDHYLGKYGSPESWEKYHRLLTPSCTWGPTTAASATISAQHYRRAGSLRGGS